MRERLFEMAARRLPGFGGSGGGPLRWFVPGRIEVFGKHTDYAGGRSLLCCVERGFHVVDPYRGEPARELRSVTVVGPDLGRADAYATAALAMGSRGLGWLARLDGYESGVVAGDGRAYRSAGLPVA